MTQDKEKFVKGNSPVASAPHTLSFETYLCYTYGAWKEENNLAGLGWIFQRKILNAPTLIMIDQGAHAETFVNSSLMVEALAMRMVLFKAL